MNAFDKQVMDYELTHLCWRIIIKHKGFEMMFVIKGTEKEMQDYVKYEFGHIPAYTAMTEKEVTMWKKLGGEIYIA